MSGYQFWDTELTFLKKVGPVRAELLKKEAGLRTFYDLVNYLPFKYVDRSQLHTIRDINSHHSHVSLKGKIEEFEMVKGGKGKGRLTASFTDGTGYIELVWFRNANWVKDSLKPGTEMVIFGQPKIFGNKITISHPEIEQFKEGEEMLNHLKIVPYYSGTESLHRAGLDSRGFRSLLHQLLDRAQSEFTEHLPATVLRAFSLLPLAAAMRAIHFPESMEQLAQAQRRLKFDELFLFQLQVARKKIVEQPTRGSHPFPVVGHYLNTFYEKYIPFPLTEAQKRVIKEVRRDLARPVQMNRLIQGDVGSGKTIVAFLTMLIAIDNGFQACIMAPTEILAEQHLRNITRWAEPLGIHVAFFSGSQRKSERETYLAGLASGHFQIAVGTHALIEDPVKFQKLGLAIVDEQHKFGVMQRARLWAKAEKFPHSMVMTATPIPRTLGLTLYGDVEVSVIDELPPGRTPVITAVRGEGQRKFMLGFVTSELQKGRQAYFVYPLVEESDKVEWLAVTEGLESLSRYFNPLGFTVDLVHGRMKAEDKEYVMQRFKKGEVHVLVSTTVIEVGVDVPNASVMVIENAEKFGLSQLHQLRGRVGRGAEQSFCILMAAAKTSEEARKRLQAMAETTDGFKIAEIDLKLRGPGDFLGTRQSGMPEFKLADITQDTEIIVQARDAAFALLQNDPDLTQPQHAAIRKAFQQYVNSHEGMVGVA